MSEYKGGLAVLVAPQPVTPEIEVPMPPKSTRRVTPLAVRFWRQADRSGGPDACWPWTGAATEGYGAISVRRGVARRAPRVAWELQVGPIPDGLVVCHACDNPPCVNVNHLFLGTHADNARDKIAKGRGTKPPILAGERNRQAKLTDEAVRLMRAAYDAGETMRSLSRRFGVSRPVVSGVVRRESWKHVS